MTTRHPASVATLSDLLRWRAERSPTAIGYTFLGDGEEESGRLTFGQLDQQAREIAVHLQDCAPSQGAPSQGAPSQDAPSQGLALLVYPSGLEFVSALFGCFYAGLVAVPVPPPDPQRLERTLPRLEAVAADAKPSVVLTTRAIADAFAAQAQRSPALEAARWITTESLAPSASVLRTPPSQPHGLAVLQYTSGSTAAPKGVMVSHGNVLANSRYLQHAWGFGEDTVSLSWVPNFHDDGVINGLVQPVFSGNQVVLMPPVSVVQRPIRWLRAISRYRVQQTGGPNFVYALCNRKTAEAERQGLDLSSWRMAYNAAEPIRAETLENFVELFAPHGFRWRSFFPAYGLAETTLIVSTRRPDEDPVRLTVDKRALADHRVVPADDGVVPNDGEGKDEPAVETLTLVGSGQAILDTEVVIVDPQTGLRCPSDRVGEIWVASGSVTQGYWQRPRETADTFVAAHFEATPQRFLRTGDLGFLRQGELFVTGRVKDLIIVRGRNLYPHDLELSVEKSHPAIRAGCCAAFSVEAAGEERLVIAAEVDKRFWNRTDRALEGLEVEAVIRAIRRAISEDHALQVGAFRLLAPGSLPKTSSGKLQRRRCRLDFLAGRPEALAAWDAPELRSRPSSLEGVATPSEATRSGVTQETADPRALPELLDWIRDYAEHRFDAYQADARRSMPPGLVLDLGNQGLLGLQVDRAHGGLGFGESASLRVLEQLAAVDLTLATLVTGHNYLGIRPIARHAHADVRDALLPDLAQGRSLASFALTEPGAGSAVRNLAAQAEPDGAGGWRLRGSKVWIGSAAWASVFNVFVRLADPGAAGDGALTGFVVLRHAPGLRVGAEALTLGLRGMSQNAVELDGVPVGPRDVLGSVGAGMTVAEDAMQRTRLAIAAMSVGGMKRCAQLAHRYASRRTIATGRLLDNPRTLMRLSDLTAATGALEALVFAVAGQLDGGQDVPEEALLACKTSGPELLWQAADDLVQLLGGRGYVETNVAPRILRDARVFRIFEGPTEALLMHLGARAMRRGEVLGGWLAGPLGAGRVAEGLDEGVAAIHRRVQRDMAPFADRPSATRWGQHLAGELATHAVLLAAAEHRAQRASSELGGDEIARLAVDWARQAFERRHAEACGDLRGPRVLLEAASLNRIVSGYGESIGDVESQATGADLALDPMLRRDPEAVRPKAVVSTDDTDGLGVHSHTPALAPADGGEGGRESRSLDPGHSLESSKASAGQAQITGWVTSWLGQELGLDTTTLEPDRPLAELGIDSVLAVDLAQLLEDRLGRPLEATVLWRFPTIESLARYLADDEPAGRQTHSSEPPQAVSDADDPAADLESLPEDELARLLASEIAAVRDGGHGDS